MSELETPNIYLLLVHPFPHRSKVNRALAEGISELPGVDLCDLYERYPDFHIDVEREQSALRDADMLVVQHPFYWYSAPAMLKQWQDVVLEYGFAFGAGGDAMKGKDFMSVISAGQSKAAYRKDGHNGHVMQEILTPYECMANHCGMNYLDPILIFNSHQLREEELSEWIQIYRERLINYRPGGSSNND